MKRSKKYANRVDCLVEQAMLVDDQRQVDGIVVKCSRCGQQTESFGISEASIERCLALLNKNCGRGEHNWYFPQDDYLTSPALEDFEPIDLDVYRDTDED